MMEMILLYIMRLWEANRTNIKAASLFSAARKKGSFVHFDMQIRLIFADTASAVFYTQIKRELHSHLVIEAACVSDAQSFTDFMPDFYSASLSLYIKENRAGGPEIICKNAEHTRHKNCYRTNKKSRKL